LVAFWKSKYEKQKKLDSLMTTDRPTSDEIRAMASDIGLTRLTDEHLQQLLKATRTAQARRAALPVSRLVPADEPAHVFRAEDGQ
jgi:hypothetical protein